MIKLPDAEQGFPPGWYFDQHAAEKCLQEVNGRVAPVDTVVRPHRQ